MKKIFTYITLIAIIFSCASIKKKPEVNINDLIKTKDMSLYKLEDNHYYYFMVDSLNNGYIVKMKMFSNGGISYIEKMQKIKQKKR